MKLSVPRKKLAISASFVIFLFVGVEISLRSILGLGFPLLYVAADEYGYFPAPNQSLHRFFVHVKTNHEGMRSNEFRVAKAPGTLRILFVGDSVTFGTTYVDQAQIFSSIVAEKLSHSTTVSTEILNASAGGWAPDNEVGFIRSKGIFNADYVIFVLNTADLTQPFVPFTPSAQFPTRAPMTAIEEAWTRYLLPRLTNHGPASDPGSTASNDPDIEGQTPMILKTLFEAKAITDAQLARFEIIYSPATSREIEQYRDHWNKGIDLLIRWAEAQNVPLIDMRGPFARYPAPTVYFDGIHLRPLGHQLIAEAVVRALGW
jgi:lysophospholipase L1-like esterase